MRKRWFTREQLEKAKTLSKRVDLGIRTAEKSKKSILNTLEQSVDGLGLGKELYASYLSNTPFGNIKVTPRLLEEYGFDRNTIAAMIKMRRLIDQNSKEIESLIRELDPETEIWSEELRETIRNRLGAYITKSYEMNVNPEYIKNDLFTLTFNRPNGTLASKEQKQKHFSAKKVLSEDLFRKGRVSSKFEADKKAEEMLNNLYDRQLSASPSSLKTIFPVSSFTVSSLPKNNLTFASPGNSLKETTSGTAVTEFLISVSFIVGSSNL